MLDMQITDTQWQRAHSIIRQTTIPGHEDTPEDVIRAALQAHLWLSANRQHWSQLPPDMGERETLSPIITALLDAGILNQLTNIMRATPPDLDEVRQPPPLDQRPAHADAQSQGAEPQTVLDDGSSQPSSEQTSRTNEIPTENPAEHTPANGNREDQLTDQRQHSKDNPDQSDEDQTTPHSDDPPSTLTDRAQTPGEPKAGPTDAFDRHSPAGPAVSAADTRHAPTPSGEMAAFEAPEHPNDTAPREAPEATAGALPNVEATAGSRHLTDNIAPEGTAPATPPDQPAVNAQDTRPEFLQEAYPEEPNAPKADINVIKSLEEWVAYYHHMVYQYQDPGDLDQLAHFYRVLDMMYVFSEAEIGPIQRRVFPRFPEDRLMDRKQIDDAISYTLTWLRGNLKDITQQLNNISNLIDHHQFQDPTKPTRPPRASSALAMLHLEPISDHQLELHARLWAKDHDAAVDPKALALHLYRNNYPDVDQVPLAINLERVIKECPHFGDPTEGIYPLKLLTRRTQSPPQKPADPQAQPSTSRSAAPTRSSAAQRRADTNAIRASALEWADSNQGTVTLPAFSIHLQNTKFPQSTLHSLGQRTSHALRRDQRFVRQAPGHFILTGTKGATTA